MNKFEDREKSFEKKFANDQEVQFKVNALKNKYIAEWVAEILGKNTTEKEIYIQEVIKSDFQEPGDNDVFEKIKKDLISGGKKLEDKEIRHNMELALARAKKNFL